MSSHFKIAVLVGSLRKESLSRKIAKALISIAPSSLQFEFLDIGTLPFFNEDMETNPPLQAWADFRKSVRNTDGVFFVTPEYNRSVPAVLKNALDVGSRPYGQSVWNGKPGAVISISQGGVGGFGANHHLRQSLVCLNVPTMQQPEAYIGNAGTLLSDTGDILTDETRIYFESIMNTYAAWVATNIKK